MGNETGVTDRPIDRAAICLAEWIERGRGYHTETWGQWVRDTEADLELHTRRQAEIRELVKAAQWALFDHNLPLVAAKLNRLMELV